MRSGGPVKLVDVPVGGGCPCYDGILVGSHDRGSWVAAGMGAAVIFATWSLKTSTA